MNRPLRTAPIVALLLLAWALAPSPSRAQEAPGEPSSRKPTSCVACHGSPEWFADQHIQEIVRDYSGGAHEAAELGCEDCHGGNPDPALSQDVDGAMDPNWEENPFIGVPKAQEIPAFCGRCHSDPNYMRQYQPDPRVDQVREYLTSQHGQALLKEGDPKVATCVDCHGTHGILGSSQPQSPVYPTNVARTCSKCHSKGEYMEGYTDDHGRQLPVDQYARWTQSVHAAAMFEKEDLTAPTCNDCHGNHGAAPPGIDSVAFVCGQCHGREAGLFRASTKREGFQGHAAYIEGMGPGACSNCHAAESPQAELEHFAEFSECSTCHGNHAVVRPSIAMLSPLPEIPCAFCHEGNGPLADEAPADGALPPEPEDVQEHYREVRDGLLARAEQEGLEGEELFDWMVDQALRIEPHHLPATEAPPAEAAAEEAEAEADEPAAETRVSAGLEMPPNLRPEFEHLFEKFRIGKTYFTYEDPASGEPVRASVRRCSDCHAREPQLASEAVGWNTGDTMLRSMRELTALTARAERITLAAKRGGVHTEEAQLAVDRAVDAQIQLEVLVHTFDASEGSEFATRHEEGVDQATTALEAAQQALDELEYRRTGLVVSLVVILLVLIGLGLKIRQMSG